MKLSALLIAGAAVAALASSAQALTVTYSFTNTVGNISGTVSGHIDGLVDNATSAATAVWVDSYPVGLAGSLGLPSYSTPFDVLADWTDGSLNENSFTMAGGVVTAAFFSLVGANGDEDQLYLNSACDCLGGTGHTNFLDIGTGDGSFVWNTGELHTAAGLLIPGGVSPGVPEPATWALMIGGVGLAGAALRRRRALAAA